MAFFAALAEAADVRFAAEVDVAAGQLGEFGDGQARAQGEQEQCAVAPAGPGPRAGGVEQRLRLVVGEEADHGGAGALAGDGQDALDGRGVFGCLPGGVAEQRADGGQAGVAGARAVAAFGFQVVQEG